MWCNFFKRAYLQKQLPPSKQGEPRPAELQAEEHADMLSKLPMNT